VTHIADLAPYDYYRGAPAALAVEWLDVSEPLATGVCPPDVRDRLASLGLEPVRLMRGYHYCQSAKRTHRHGDLFARTSGSMKRPTSRAGTAKSG
jgi:hypothetical protein